MPKIVDHQVRRNELSAVAARLIAQGGLEAATIREIARHSGFSKGVIEHYFDNKEEIISAALDWANACFQSRVDNLTDGFSGFAALRKRLEATLPLSEAVRDEWKVRLVFWSMAAIHNNLRKQQEQRFNRAIEYFEGDLKHAIKAGELHADIDVSEKARRVVNVATGVSIASLHNLPLYSKSFLLQEIDYIIETVST